MAKLIKYILRWQASTLILWPVMQYLPFGTVLEKTIVANFIGALCFFPADQYIFKSKK